MPVYHPHIIPSLALQAYNARNTVQSRIKIRRLMDPKEVGPSASSGTRLKVGEGGQGAGAYKFLLHINTSLKRKRRFFKCPFTIHTLFLRLRFRLITQKVVCKSPTPPTIFEESKTRKNRRISRRLFWF